MFKGTVKWFNQNKGFGFIEQDNGSDVFVHANAIQQGISPPYLQEGERVEFEVLEGTKGPMADKVIRLPDVTA